MAKPLGEMWDSFNDDVIHPDASPLQRQELRRAFMAGARIVLIGLETASRSDVNEASGVRMLADMNRECEEFSAQIGADF
jgi:hypothetical protein